MLRWFKVRLSQIIEWKINNGLNILRVSLGIVFLWFGFIKFFPGLSTAEAIASKTIAWITRERMQANWSMPILGVWECVIGIGLILKKQLTLILFLLYMQMIGTLLPLVIFRTDTWTDHLFVPTLLGQYIIKNAILISSGIVLGATINGGGLSASPGLSGWFTRKKLLSRKIS